MGVQFPRQRELLKYYRERGYYVIAGGSYSFNIWPADLVARVSPGSFTYSSSEHAADLVDLGWRIAGYVVATVISARDGSVTLDAGAKAISPDKPMTERFSGAGAIRFMNEEHVVVASDRLRVGERVALVPRHACTAAYLYERALVRGLERLPQSEALHAERVQWYRQHDAWDKLAAGASLVQLYTGFVYGGPGTARAIAAGLLERMDREGVRHLSEVVGSLTPPR